MAAGGLAASGGARPTGLAAVDAVLLAVGGVALAACALRARTIPVYVAASVVALCQPASVPLVLACLALAAAFLQHFRRGTLAGVVAGGLAWAAMVGAPGEAGARPFVVPLLAMAWVVVSARRHASARFRQRLDLVVAGIGGAAVAGTVLGGVALIGARAHVDRGADLLDSGLAAAREGDTATAVADLRAARRVLGQGEDTLGALWARPAWLVPGVSQNARALHTLVAEVSELAAVGITTAEAADLDGLRARQGQIDLAAVGRVEEPLAIVLAQLEASDRRLAGFGDQALVGPVSSRLRQVRAELADAIPSARLALDGVRAAPGLLGGNGERTYLVLFTTPVESRARTGFPGNFAEITFRDGRFDKTRFGRISELDGGTPALARTSSASEEYLARYDRFDGAANWRSITYTPDFPTVARLAAELYPQSGGRSLDGVMSVDPVALAALLQFTGPIAVPGVAQPLDAENAAQFLLFDQYVDFPDSPDRVDVLETLSDITLDRLTSADLPAPRELGQILGPVVTEGHLQLMTFDDAEEHFLDGLGITGRFPAVEGDFVAVTTSNIAMNKIDLFLRRTLDYAVLWDPSSGALEATATITLTNEAPASGLPPYLIGNNVGSLRPGGKDLPDGWNYTFVTLYTPWLPTDATLDGQPLALQVLPELGRHAISAFVELPPGGSATIEIDLEGILRDGRYLLDVAAQPQALDEQMRLQVRVTGGGTLQTTGPVERRGRAAEGAFPLVRDVRVTVAG